MIAILLTGCTVPADTLFGHWMERGSSTFTNRFQCVEPFQPFKNKEC